MIKGFVVNKGVVVKKGVVVTKGFVVAKVDATVVCAQFQHIVNTGCGHVRLRQLLLVRR